MARFEGARKMEKSDQRIGTSLGDLLRNAGVEGAKQVVEVQAKADEERLSVVSAPESGESQDETSAEIAKVTVDTKEALDENVDSTQVELDRAAEMKEDMERTAEVVALEERQAAMVRETSRLSNDAEEVVHDVKALSKLFEDEIAASGMIPKSMKQLKIHYDNGVILFANLAQKLFEQSASVGGAELTEEALNNQQDELRKVSLEIQAIKRSFKADTEPLLKKLKNQDSDDVQGLVESVEFSNQTLYEHIDALAQNYARVAAGEYEAEEEAPVSEKVEEPEVVADESAAESVPEAPEERVTEAVESEQNEKVLEAKRAIEQETGNALFEIVDIANAVDRALSEEDKISKDLRQIFIKFEVELAKMKTRILQMRKQIVEFIPTGSVEEQDSLKLDSYKKISESLVELKREFQSKAQVLDQNFEGADLGAQAEEAINKIKLLKDTYNERVGEGEEEQETEIDNVISLFKEPEEEPVSEPPESGVRPTLTPEVSPLEASSVQQKTEIAEKGETGTLIGDEKEMLRNAGGHVTPDLLKNIPYPGSEDTRVTVGEDYLTPEEMVEYGETPMAISEETKKEMEKMDIEEPEGDSLEDVAEDILREEEAKKAREEELKNEEVPMSLHELFEEDETAEPEKVVPVITPEVADAKDPSELFDLEADKADQEQVIMGLLGRFEVVTNIDKEEVNRLVAEAEPLIELYRQDYGDEEATKLQTQFIEKLDKLINEAKARNESLPAQVAPSVEGAVGLDEAQEQSGISPESAMAAAGVAAAAMAEKGPRTVEMSAEEQLRSEISSVKPGDWHEAFAKGKFTKEHWRLLTVEERTKYLELEKEIREQEAKLAHLKEAKDAMERVLRAEYGNQFEVSARAQKFMREKGNQITKLEALLNRSKREQEILREKGVERMEKVMSSMKGKMQ
jgi:hypothetical protein